MKNAAPTQIDSLGEALENLFGLVAWQVFRHASTMLEGEVTFARLMTLFFLYRCGPQTIAAVAESAGLSHAAASRMVDGLYKAGVVDRRESAEDRRQKQIAITPAGIERIEALQSVTAKAYSGLLADVPAAQLEGLALALTSIETYLASPDKSHAANTSNPLSKE
ncbi:MAG: MarR family transcriptional regulator [Pseudomonadota bacterium]